MTENENKPDLTRLEMVEQNLKAALNAWTEEINVYELPVAMQRKQRVAIDKMVSLMCDVHQYLNTKRRVGRPAGGLTKTAVRNELKNATPEQLAAIAKILGHKPETEISSVSSDMEEVNYNE